MEDFKEYRLENLGEFCKGTGIPKSSIIKGGQYKAIRYAELYTRYGIIIKEVFSRVGSKDIGSSKQIKYGDILLAGSGEDLKDIGKTAVYALYEPCYVGGDTIIFRPKENQDGIYLGYLFNTENLIRQRMKYGQGNSIVHIYTRDLAKMKVRIPLFQEQKEIVSIIEKWDKHIELLDQKIQIKKNIRKYLTQKLLNGEKRLPGFKEDWRLSRLGEIGFFKTSSIDKKIKDGESIVNLVNYMDVYRHKEITNANRKNLMRVSAKDDQIRNNNLIKGDILFTPSSETPDDIGHSIVISEDLSNTLYSYHLVRFRPSISLDIKFAHYFCNQNEVLRQFTKYASGVTRFTLSLDSFSRVEVKIPPFKEQKAISSILSKSDEEITMLEKQKNIIEEQRKYLLNNLVTGEIRLPKFRINK